MRHFPRRSFAAAQWACTSSHRIAACNGWSRFTALQQPLVEEPTASPRAVRANLRIGKRSSAGYARASSRRARVTAEFSRLRWRRKCCDLRDRSGRHWRHACQRHTARSQIRGFLWSACRARYCAVLHGVSVIVGGLPPAQSRSPSLRDFLVWIVVASGDDPAWARTRGAQTWITMDRTARVHGPSRTIASVRPAGIYRDVVVPRSKIDTTLGMTIPPRSKPAVRKSLHELLTCAKRCCKSFSCHLPSPAPGSHIGHAPGAMREVNLRSWTVDNRARPAGEPLRLSVTACAGDAANVAPWPGTRLRLPRVDWRRVKAITIIVVSTPGLTNFSLPCVACHLDWDACCLHIHHRSAQPWTH